MVGKIEKVGDMILHGDCVEELKKLPENSVDAVVTDPPYELGFMGKSWDASGIAYNVDMWREVARVLKPGGHLLSFGGSRTYHRMACAIEDAGFEIRDQIMWVYGSGFPKSLNIGKAVDKLQGNEREELGYREDFVKRVRKNGVESKEYVLAGGWKADPTQVGKITKGTSEWEGWGTALKPSHEPIVLARKPLGEKTVAENVLKYGTGGINIDESRVGTEDTRQKTGGAIEGSGWGTKGGAIAGSELGRFPANFIHDGSEEVVGLMPNTGATKPHKGDGRPLDTRNQGWGFKRMPCELSDTGGSAARFFYCAKASKSERNRGCEQMPEKTAAEITGRKPGSKGLKCGLAKMSGVYKNTHPTVKPLALMKYLIKLVTRKGGTVLDPFMGSGTTGMACKELGMDFIGIEKEADYIKIAEARIAATKYEAKLI